LKKLFCASLLAILSLSASAQIRFDEVNVNPEYTVTLVDTNKADFSKSYADSKGNIRFQIYDHYQYVYNSKMVTLKQVPLDSETESKLERILSTVSLSCPVKLTFNKADHSLTAVTPTCNDLDSEVDDSERGIDVKESSTTGQKTSSASKTIRK
jgi:hypothetical protein